MSRSRRCELTQGSECAILGAFETEERKAMPQWTDQQLSYYLTTKDTAKDWAPLPKARPDAPMIEAWLSLLAQITLA